MIGQECEQSDFPVTYKISQRRRLPDTRRCRGSEGVPALRCNSLYFAHFHSCDFPWRSVSPLYYVYPTSCEFFQARSYKNSVFRSCNVYD